MSFFNCPHCQGRIDISAKGKAAASPKPTACRCLGKSKSIRGSALARYRRAGALLGEEAPEAKSIYAMARAVASRLAAKPAAARVPSCRSIELSPTNRSPFSAHLECVTAMDSGYHKCGCANCQTPYYDAEAPILRLAATLLAPHAVQYFSLACRRRNCSSSRSNGTRGCLPMARKIPASEDTGYSNHHWLHGMSRNPLAV